MLVVVKIEYFYQLPIHAFFKNFEISITPEKALSWYFFFFQQFKTVIQLQNLYSEWRIRLQIEIEKWL